MVKHKMELEAGKITEVESNTKDNNAGAERNATMSLEAGVQWCEQMERLCLDHIDTSGTLELTQSLWQFWGHLQKLEMGS